MAVFRTEKNLSIALGKYFAEFKDGKLETKDKDFILALRMYPRYGKDYYEVVESKEDKPRKRGRQPKK